MRRAAEARTSIILGAMKGRLASMLILVPMMVNAMEQAEVLCVRFLAGIPPKACATWRAICSNGFKTSGMKTTKAHRSMVRLGAPMMIALMQRGHGYAEVGGTIRVPHT